MRGTTQTIYSLVFRAQAVFGLVLVACLITAVLVAGQYAGTAMIVGVIAGVISFACIWPYLTPRWLGRPSRKGQLIPLIGAHLTLLLLYSFIATSAVLAFGLEDALNRQFAVGAISVLCASGFINLTMGVRLCLRPRDIAPEVEGGAVTELVLPRITSLPIEVTKADEDRNPFSKAS